VRSRKAGSQSESEPRGEHDGPWPASEPKKNRLFNRKKRKLKKESFLTQRAMGRAIGKTKGKERGGFSANKEVFW